MVETLCQTSQNTMQKFCTFKLNTKYCEESDKEVNWYCERARGVHKKVKFNVKKKSRINVLIQWNRVSIQFANIRTERECSLIDVYYFACCSPKMRSHFNGWFSRYKVTIGVGFLCVAFRFSIHAVWFFVVVAFVLLCWIPLDFSVNRK